MRETTSPLTTISKNYHHSCENLLWSQWHRSCRGNEMTPLSTLPEGYKGYMLLTLVKPYFSAVGTLLILPKSFTEAFFSNSRLDVQTKSITALSNLLEWSFYGQKYGKPGLSWSLAVIYRKRSAFETQFHLIVVSIFLKTCEKVHGAEDSFSRLQERRIWLICFEALLWAVW